MAAQPDAARRDFEHAIALDPDASGAHYMLASALMGSDPPRALAEADRSIALEPTPAIYHQLRGMLRQDVGDLAGAKADLDLAVERDPKTFLMGSARAGLNLERGDCAAAREDALQARALFKNHPLDAVTEALADVFVDDVPAAARLLRDVAQRAPEAIAARSAVSSSTPDAMLARIGRDPARAPKAQLAWGLVAAARGEPVLANQHFEQALEADPRLADSVRFARKSFNM